MILNKLPLLCFFILLTADLAHSQQFECPEHDPDFEELGGVPETFPMVNTPQDTIDVL